MNRLLLAFLALTSVAAFAQPKGWNDAFPPHKVMDNLYYVGTKELASFLFVTPQGNILMNSNYESSVPVIRANVEQLGFKFKDIRILLTSHAHSDHVAGNALIKEITGAQVYVMQGDENVVANGGRGQYLYDSLWKPCKADRVLKDGDTVKLGDTTLTARLTPGHTRGCTT